MFRKITKKQVLKSLSRHKDITTDFLNEVNAIPKEILENLGNDLAKKAISMSREVDGDLYNHKAFLRLYVSPHGILYAKLDKMKHYNEKLLLKFFKKRFPTFNILIESKRGIFRTDRSLSAQSENLSLEEALKELENKLPIDPLLINLKEGNYQELWESFARSQIINERKDSKAIINLSNKWKTRVTIERPNIKKLDDFFD
jgi:hypothetical protein